MNFTKITIIILFLIFIFIIPVNAENLIINGDFETGDCTGWTLQGMSCTVPGQAGQGYNNSYCFKISGFSPASFSKSIYQSIDWTNVDNISFWYYMPSFTNSIFEVRYGDMSSGDLLFSSNTRYSWIYIDIDTSSYSGIENLTFGARNVEYGGNPAINVNIDEISTISVNISDSFIQFENTPFLEYDNAIVNFSVEKIMNDYSDKRIFLEIATPKITDPYYNYVAYELSDYTGYRGLAIEGKHPTYDAYHNCTAYLRAYELNMSNYETLLEIEESVLTDNHTLLKYTGYDYPINKSYITGSYIGIDVDIMDYIETDFLYWPDEHFLLHVNGFSNSNQGDREYEYHIDPKYWGADHYHVHHFSCDVWNIIDSDFNSTIESYITVYRNGNTTQLTPTIYTNTYAEGYIPENETGYIPPDIPEEPEEPEIPDPDPEPEPNPDYPIPPDQPNGTGANQTVNVSWTGEYYIIVNNTVGSLGSPIYNFTGWTLSPVTKLNSSIGEFNYYMNESFTQTSEDSSILYESINTIYDAIHPKIRNVITYYLIWVVLLIILKKD